MSSPLNTAVPRDALAQCEVSERLFVWGFRGVAQCRRLAWPSMSEIQQVYGHFGVASAVTSLDAMLELFACTAHRAIELHCPGCPCMSTSEHLLLQAISAAQRGETERARERFENWLPDVAADWVLGPACGVGRIFADGGLSFPKRETSIASFPDTMSMQTWPVGSPTLH